jgi:hypothetical protein
MKNGIGNSLDCADAISVSQISRSERATIGLAVVASPDASFRAESSGAVLKPDGTSSIVFTAGRAPSMPHMTNRQTQAHTSK